MTTAIVDTVDWPKGTTGMLSIKAEYSWAEYGILMRLLHHFNIGLLVETGIGNGDLTALMISKSMFDEHFHYYGITNNLDIVDPIIKEVILGNPRVLVSAGVCTSIAMLGYIKKLINNSYKRVMVLCDGVDVVCEYNAFKKIVRPGDIICVSGFPYKFGIKDFKKDEEDEKIKRIGSPLAIRTSRFFVGEIL